MDPLRLRALVAICLSVTLLSLPSGGGSAAAGGCKAPKPSGTSQKKIVCGYRLQSVTRVTDAGGLGRIEVAGKIGAVLQREEGIVSLLDLKNPGRPKVVGSYDDGASDSLDGDLAFSKDRRFLFYARQTRNFSKEGIHVLDVQDPSTPQLASYAPAGGSLRLAYHNDGDAEWVILLDAITGLVVYRFEPASAQLIPVFVDALPALKVGGPMSAGVVVDRKDPQTGAAMLYVTTGRTGLQMYDFSDPVGPVLLGSWTEETGLADIAVVATRKSRTVFAATEYWFRKPLEPQVIRLNATDPGSITEERRFSLGAPADDLWRVQEIDFQGGELHVAHSHLGMVVLDPKGNVKRVARVPGPSAVQPPAVAPYAYGVALAGGWTYVTDAASGALWTLSPPRLKSQAVDADAKD